MSNNRYTYLFPYEKVPQGSRIIIYGAGDVGQEYLQQMMMTRYCEVIAFLDRAYDKYPTMVIPVQPPEKVTEMHFDYIIIAMKTAVFCGDVVKYLCSKGVSEERIIHVGARCEAGSIYTEESLREDVNLEYAYKKGKLSIALKFGPGLGDALIKKRLFKEIVSMAPEARIDIYTPGGAPFIKSFYADEPNLNCAIDDGGTRYAQHHKEYGLSMSIFFMIQIDHIEYGRLKEINPKFAEQMQLHAKRHSEYGLSLFPTVQNHLHFRRAMYLGRNCYSLYNYTDIFHIDDQKVYIPLQDKYRKEYENLSLGHYVTFNYGNGATGRGNKETISKQWPKEYFEEFAQIFKSRYPRTSLIQLGDNHTEPIPCADKILLGMNLELVKHILCGSLLHLDIEGGLMHLATQLGTKCVVLYGPTQVELFGYPQNINIVSEKCKSCYLLYPDYYRCAKGLEKPECMWSITPDIVMGKIDAYLRSIEMDD